MVSKISKNRILDKVKFRRFVRPTNYTIITLFISIYFLKDLNNPSAVGVDIFLFSLCFSILISISYYLGYYYPRNSSRRAIFLLISSICILIDVWLVSITIQMAIKKEKPTLNINVDLAKPYAHLGFALFKTGEREKAIKHIEKSINLDPNYHRAPLYLAKIYYDLKNHKEALKHINGSLIINEKFSEGIELRKKILKLIKKKKKSDFDSDKFVI